MRIPPLFLGWAALTAAYLISALNASLSQGYDAHPAFPLDDAYIFFQYAAQAAKGAWFQYQGGALYSTGVTSPLYLGVLALGAKLGLPAAWFAFCFGSACLAFSIGRFEKLRTALFPELPQSGALALFLCLGPLGAAYFNGLESGLFLALLLWALESLGKEKPGWSALAALWALAWCRPEGQMAAAFLGMWAFARGHFNFFAFAATLLHAGAPSLLNYGLTGSFMPDSLRPKAFALASLPLDAHLRQSLEYAGAAFKGIFMGLYGPGEAVGAAGGAAAGNPPSVLYAPLSLLAAATGFSLAWPRLRGAKAFVGWALLAFAVQAWFLPVGWHQHRYLLPYAPLMLLGAALFVVEADSRLKGLGRVFFWSWAVFGTLSSTWFLLKHHQMSSLHRAMHGKAAQWARTNTPPKAPLAVVDAGILAFESGRPIVDLLGITDHRLALAAREGKDAMLWEIGNRPPEQRPRYAALHWGRPDFNPEEWVRLGLIHEVAFIETPEGGRMGLFRFRPVKPTNP